MPEMVDHPQHYSGKYECIEIMRDLYGDEFVKNFCIGNAFKYLWRFRKKNGMQDLSKAKWYLEYVERMEKHESN